jgi:pyrroline-5-carboxylate reductase
MTPKATTIDSLQQQPNADMEANNNKQGLSLGFIGCGTISTAIVTGIAKQTRVDIARISVSRRSRQKSDDLAKTFPDLVTVHDDNQEIIDKCDIIFLCVLPEQANNVVRDLQFETHRHKLISIVATADLTDLSKHSGVPLSNMAKMICTPSIAQHEGACLVYPRQDAKSSVLVELFDAIGGCVQSDTNEQMTTLMSSMCVMGPVYGILKTHRDWMIAQGIAKEDASFLVGKQYQAIVNDLERHADEPDRLEELIEEQTPGGINQQALDNLDSLGGLDAYARSLDAIAGRINGTSDGEAVSD